MKKILSIFLTGIFVFINCYLFAQNKSEADSLQELLKKNLHDTVRLQVLTDLHWAYINSEIEKAKEIAIKEIILAEKIKNEKWIAQGYNDLGIAYYRMGLLDSALHYYNQSLSIREKLNNPDLLLSSYSKIGVIYYEKGKLNEALDYQLKALKLMELQGNKKYIAFTLNNISQIYHKLKNYEKEIEFLENAISLHNEFNDEYAIASAWSNIGNVYRIKGDIKKSYEYLYKAMEVFQKYDDKVSLAGVYSNIGFNYRFEKNNNEALKYYSKAFEMSNALNDRIGIALTAHNMSCVYTENGNYKLAEKFSLLALENTDSDNVTQLSNTYRQLATIYGYLNQGKKAEECLNKYTELKEKTFNENFASQLAEMETRYETDKKELEISNLKNEQQIKDLTISKQQTRNFYLIILVIALLVLAGFIFYAFRSKSEANKLITVQKLEVENQKAVIEEKNKEIVDSINYAKRIQHAILTSENEWKKISNNFFIVYMPKDVVSGDFYWAYQTENNIAVWAVADCTGHGVPGALMSMIGNSLLNEIVVENKIYQPDEILNKLRDKLIKALEQKGESQNRDGMDIALCVWDKNHNTLQYAGANNPIWIIRKNKELAEYELIELKPDKMPVGLHAGELKSFNVQTLKLNSDDIIYAFTDGFADQFGGEKGKKYKYKNFQTLLLANADKSMSEQSEVIKNEFYKWKGNLEQIDDVCIVGIRV
jgi:serine phosphatase RsbU (regulator of sigma subunit)